jgi:protein involved in polysaccharide export with SLBB domain
VHVWGEVQRPGLYSVPTGTTLLDLLSLAGGPTSDARLNSVRLVRGPDTGSEAPPVVTIDLDAFKKEADGGVRHPLGPGDTLILDAKPSSGLLKWTGFLGVLALVANVVVNASD